MRGSRRGTTASCRGACASCCAPAPRRGSRRIARQVGFDQVLCTRVAWTADGRLAGGLDGGNLKGEAKLAAVRRAVSAWRAAPFVIAYSDHHADLPLLRWADRGVAVCPTRKLAAAAAAEDLAVENWG